MISLDVLLVTRSKWPSVCKVPGAVGYECLLCAAPPAQLNDPHWLKEQRGDASGFRMRSTGHRIVTALLAAAPRQHLLRGNQPTFDRERDRSASAPNAELAVYVMEVPFDGGHRNQKSVRQLLIAQSRVKESE